MKIEENESKEGESTVCDISSVVKILYKHGCPESKDGENKKRYCIANENELGKITVILRMKK